MRKVKYPERQSAIGSAGRNKAAILDTLSPWLRKFAQSSHVLELASGEGEHVAHIAASFSTLYFVPTDADAELCLSINQRCQALALTNVKSAIQLDFDDGLPNHSLRMAAAGQEYAGVLLFNVIHIVPWHTVKGIITAAACLLASRGYLFLYGAFKENGKWTSEGNASFDAVLRGRDSRFGLRDLQEELVPLALLLGLELVERIDLPAGNLFVVFQAST